MKICSACRSDGRACFQNRSVLVIWKQIVENAAAFLHTRNFHPERKQVLREASLIRVKQPNDTKEQKEIYESVQGGAIGLCRMWIKAFGVEMYNAMDDQMFTMIPFRKKIIQAALSHDWKRQSVRTFDPLNLAE